MMGKQPQRQAKLFYYHLSLEERIPQDHLLRQIQTMVDFDFTYALVEKHYGIKGNVSVPPPVILKLMLLLFLYNVSSERELMRTLPYRLDWLWFLGYDLDSEIPNHSVLSKARRRTWLMEGSFGDAATHHGFKRARWRRLWRQRIQDLLIATVQNLRMLVRHAGRRIRGACAQVLGSAAPVVHAGVTALARCPDVLTLLVEYWLLVRLCAHRRCC